MRWDSKRPKGAYGTAIWKAIYTVFEEFRSNMGVKVGRGNMIKFWKETWCGNRTFKVAFPSIYRIAGKKEGLVQ